MPKELQIGSVFSKKAWRGWAGEFKYTILRLVKGCPCLLFFDIAELSTSAQTKQATWSLQAKHLFQQCLAHRIQRRTYTRTLPFHEQSTLDHQGHSKKSSQNLVLSTSFQLILPVDSQMLQKIGMHVGGPQICQINRWNNSFQNMYGMNRQQLTVWQVKSIFCQETDHFRLF